MFTQTEDSPHTLSMSTTFTTSTTLVSDTRPSSSVKISKNNYRVLLVHHVLHAAVGPSQLPAGGVSGAAVGGAIAALLILAVFAAAGITILIVVIVRRQTSKKSTTLNGGDPPPIENPLYTSQGWI